MDKINPSDDVPFQLHGGDSRDVAIYNRITAINRINYLVRKTLPEFDIRTKSEDYLKCLDLEVYKKYYINEPKDKKIDEEFCQRMAKTCIDMEGDDVVLDDNEFEKFSKGFDHVFSQAIPVEEKVSPLKKFLKKMFK